MINAKQIVSELFVVVESALKVEGIEGQLAAAILAQVRQHYFGAAPPAATNVASLAGGLIGAVVAAAGGQSQVAKILAGEFAATTEAADAEAAAVLGKGTSGT